jgi:hypothetical protein
MTTEEYQTCRALLDAYFEDIGLDDEHFVGVSQGTWTRARWASRKLAEEFGENEEQ